MSRIFACLAILIAISSCATTPPSQSIYSLKAPAKIKWGQNTYLQKEAGTLGTLAIFNYFLEGQTKETADTGIIIQVAQKSQVDCLDGLVNSFSPKMKEKIAVSFDKDTSVVIADAILYDSEKKILEQDIVKLYPTKYGKTVLVYFVTKKAFDPSVSDSTQSSELKRNTPELRRIMTEIDIR